MRLFIYEEVNHFFVKMNLYIFINSIFDAKKIIFFFVINNQNFQFFYLNQINLTIFDEDYSNQPQKLSTQLLTLNNLHKYNCFLFTILAALYGLFSKHVSSKDLSLPSNKKM